MEHILGIWNWAITNKEWVFGGFGVVAVVWFFGLIGFIFKMFEKIFSKDKNSLLSLTINNTVGSSEDTKDEPKTCKHTQEERKKLTKILFIDDETNFRVISILKKAGWENTKLVKKVTGPDDEQIIKADICFVDINGVAKDLFPAHEGLGLVGAIRDRHPKKKVVVYSSQHQRDAFDSLWDKASARLSKNADPYEFENLIENYSEEIYC